MKDRSKWTGFGVEWLSVPWGHLFRRRANAPAPAPRNKHAAAAGLTDDTVH